MTPPLLKGGQGRSSDDVRDSALAILWPWIALVVFWVLAVAYCVAFGGRK